ncbi:hypothetical protein BGW80DRAFT_1382508 [Lactifluus volemus]|nr:hypothetical protein BGW80DRAFT_1382508 [Lactifluus volemus]
MRCLASDQCCSNACVCSLHKNVFDTCFHKCICYSMDYFGFPCSTFTIQDHS